MFSQFLANAPMLATVVGHEGAIASILVASAIGAAIAGLAGMAASLSQGFAAAKAAEAVGRQPGAAGEIRSTMIIGTALAETGGVYGLFIALMLIFANPFVDMYLQAIASL